MKRRYAVFTLLSALFIVTLGATAVSAHPESVNGVVVSVLVQQREVAVRRDDLVAGSSVITLFGLSPTVAVASLHAGDRIVARLEKRAGRPRLEDVHVVPDVAAPSVLQSVPVLQVGDHMPPTRFIDQFGGSFDFSQFRGKFVVLAFIYTRCRDPKECPLVSSNFHTLQKRIDSDSYHLVELTLDPAYDRPAVLAKYGTLFGADPKRWTLATGDPGSVLRFAARFALDPFADPRIGLIHTERTVLIDRDGKIVDFIDQAGWNPQDINARLQAADSQPSNVLARLDFELSKVAVAVCGNRVAGFSGLADLAIVLVIVGGGAWMLLRLARKIFAEQI